MVNRGLDVLTWLVVALMLAPVFWLVASSLQNDGQLARGSYDLLHPTFTAFKNMWKTVDFERYFINSAIICTVAALLATAFASTAGYALARFRFRGARPFGLAVIGTQLIPGSMFLLPLFIGFLWIKQHLGIQLFGWSRSPNPALTLGHDPIRFCAPCMGAVGVIGKQIRYDRSLTYGEDVDFTLKQLLPCRVGGSAQLRFQRRIVLFHQILLMVLLAP